MQNQNFIFSFGSSQQLTQNEMNGNYLQLHDFINTSIFCYVFVIVDRLLWPNDDFQTASLWFKVDISRKNAFFIFA